MVHIKKVLVKFILISEVVGFSYLYFYGNNGITMLRKKRVAVAQLEKNIDQLKAEVISLEKEIYAWQTDDFYKEKVAREQLQMARKGDELFYISS